MTTELVGDVDTASLPTEGATPGSVGRTRLWSLIGQYALLCALALIVLAPLFLTLIQALSPPFTYVQEGKPLHPVAVIWKDRTWFTGGAFSVVIRTLVVLLLFGWLQRVGSPYTSWWRHARDVASPQRLVAIVGGTVALTVSLGPVFGSLYERDGSTTTWVVVAIAAVAITQFVGFVDPGRRSVVAAAISAISTAIVVVAAATVFVGAQAWTQSWESSGLGPAMERSLWMTLFITVAQVTTSILAAYAFVFLEFPFKRILFVAASWPRCCCPLEVTSSATSRSSASSSGSIRCMRWCCRSRRRRWASSSSARASGASRRTSRTRCASTATGT